MKFLGFKIKKESYIISGMAGSFMFMLLLARNMFELELLEQIFLSDIMLSIAVAILVWFAILFTE